MRAVAVNRQRLAVERVEDHQRDQFLGVLKRPVVVRAVGDERLQIVGVVVGAHEVIGRGLARRIRRVWRVRRVFTEEPGRAERAVDLVGGHVQEAEATARLGAELGNELPRRFEQHERADDIGVDKRPRTINRPIDVGLGGEIQDGIGRTSRNVSAIAARSEISARTNRTRSSRSGSSRLSRLPAYVSLSTTTMRSGAEACVRAHRTRLEPMKPAPPVMSSVPIND